MKAALSEPIVRFVTPNEWSGCRLCRDIIRPRSLKFTDRFALYVIFAEFSLAMNAQQIGN